VVLLGTDVSEERFVSMIRVERMRELETMLIVVNSQIYFPLTLILFDHSFHLNDGKNTFLLNVGCNKILTTSLPRRRQSS
jgi:hypothetical protein